MVEKKFLSANIVKASDEDFENIFSIKTGAEAWKKMEEFNVSIN